MYRKYDFNISLTHRLFMVKSSVVLSHSLFYSWSKDSDENQSVPNFETLALILV
jgi:hypothetical protein